MAVEDLEGRYKGLRHVVLQRYWKDRNCIRKLGNSIKHFHEVLKFHGTIRKTIMYSATMLTLLNCLTKLRNALENFNETPRHHRSLKKREREREYGTLFNIVENLEISIECLRGMRNVLIAFQRSVRYHQRSPMIIFNVVANFKIVECWK